MSFTVKIDRGISLPDCGLWFDAGRRQELAVVTHAHSDHAGWHRETILTAATAALMSSRLGAPGGAVRAVEYHQPIVVRDQRITLLPAGHVLGSAQVFLEAGNESLLYTGDFKLRPGLTCEPAVTVPADTLILETTFGLPRYRLPPAEETFADLLAFCRKALDDGCHAVLLVYSLGKAQELLARLGGSNLPIAVHPAVHRMCRIYESLGVRFPDFEEHAGDSGPPGVLIYPPNARTRLAGLASARTAVVTGWALDPSAKYRYRCDAAFPLSDHADYAELLECVDRVNPKRVYTVHGFVEEFAADLRCRGLEAWALGGGNQLELF